MSATSHLDELAEIRDISFTVHIFKDGATYVAHAPELDVSSCGDTDEQARKNIQDAVRGFLETSAETEPWRRSFSKPDTSATAIAGEHPNSFRLTGSRLVCHRRRLTRWVLSGRVPYPLPDL